MTAFTPFLDVKEPMTAAQRAFRAGQLTWLLMQSSIALDSPFVRESQGWRIRIERIGRHRAMEAEDIGLDEVASPRT